MYANGNLDYRIAKFHLLFSITFCNNVVHDIQTHPPLPSCHSNEESPYPKEKFRVPRRNHYTQNEKFRVAAKIHHKKKESNILMSNHHNKVKP